MFSPLIFLALFPVLIAAFIVFDKLVWLEYFSYRSYWEEDGKPHGFFWVPEAQRSTIDFPAMYQLSEQYCSVVSFNPSL